MPDATCRVEGICEETLETGDRSLYCQDPAGNVLELWDFFQRVHDNDGVDALKSSGG